MKKIPSTASNKHKQKNNQQNKPNKPSSKTECDKKQKMLYRQVQECSQSSSIHVKSLSYAGRGEGEKIPNLSLS